MGQFRIVAGALVATSMLAVSVSADARPRWHPRYDHGWRHRGGGVDAGDLILGAIIAGGIFAAVSAAKKNGGLGGIGGNRDRRGDRFPDNGADPQAREDEAASLCADAAESAARADDSGVRVRDITSVTPEGADSWRVEGVLESAQGRSYRDRDFVCGTTAGRVDFVRFGEGDRVAFR